MGLRKTGRTVPQFVPSYFGGTGGVPIIAMTRCPIRYWSIASGFLGDEQGPYGALLSALRTKAIVKRDSEAVSQLMKLARNSLPS